MPKRCCAGLQLLLLKDARRQAACGSAGNRTGESSIGQLSFPLAGMTTALGVAAAAVIANGDPALLDSSCALTAA